MSADSGAYRPTRRDSFGIAVANWWLRRVLTLGCLAALDVNHRRGLTCTCDRRGAAIGAEMSRRMCEDGDHYEVDGRCTACGSTSEKTDSGPSS